MVVTAGFRTGMLDTRCDIITVMEDDTCQCGCHVTSDKCNNKFHVFNPHACQCQCSNFHVAKNCSGPLHVWDSRACACTCRRDTWKLCPTGFCCIESFLVTMVRISRVKHELNFIQYGQEKTQQLKDLIIEVETG